MSELTAVFRARGVQCLDAPVVGSRAQADAGQLVHLVGGRTQALDRVRPVLSAIGCAVHHLGPAGSGAAMKVVVNALLGMQVAAMAELLGAACRMGLAQDRALAVLAGLPPAVRPPRPPGTPCWPAPSHRRFRWSSSRRI